MSPNRRLLLAAAAVVLVAGTAHAQLSPGGYTGGTAARPVAEEPRVESRVTRADLRERLAQLLQRGFWRPAPAPVATRAVTKKRAS